MRDPDDQSDIEDDLDTIESESELADLVCMVIASIESGEPIALDEFQATHPHLLQELRNLARILHVLFAMERSHSHAQGTPAMADQTRSKRWRLDSTSP